MVEIADRSVIWQASPADVPPGMLCDALEAALASRMQVTDEASALEAGHSPRVKGGRTT